MKLRICFTLFCLFSCNSFLHAAEQASRPNVLFIAVDDLNHWIGHLGRNRQTSTPSIDRLAGMGVSFSNAHCAAPLCAPSRAALLSGLRPGTSGIYFNDSPWATTVTAEQSLVTRFRAAGYETLGMGKLWHGGLGYPEQWADRGREDNTGNGKSELTDRSVGGIRFGILHGDDESVSDTAIADYGIRQLKSSHEGPFFLTLGFRKPHMPWNVPQKYFDMHPLDQIQLPPVQEDDLNDIPPAGLRMAKPEGDHATMLESGRWKEAVQAYLATVSYVDGQIGRVLDALEQSEYAGNTIICLWGDHGWHLGEKQHWRKFALWEEATRAPLIWVVPGMTQPGTVCSQPVDFMSIYPTLCGLAQIPLPGHVEGVSIQQLLQQPETEWKQPAITTFGRNNHSVRDSRWRYIHYADGSEELYDHESDPYEWTNLAQHSEHAPTISRLAAFLPRTNNPEAEPPPQPEKTPAGNNRKKAPARKARNAAVIRAAKTVVPTSVAVPGSAPAERLNIVWLIVEDMSADFSCYGQSDIQTPHVDALAASGTRFSQAFVTAPICSICRSALITGRYQTSIGAEQHRSSVPGHEITLPEPVRPVAGLFRESGYHTSNLTVNDFLRSDTEARDKPAVRIAKTDYNFVWDQEQNYDRTHWSTRSAGQPFFVQVQLQGGKLRGKGNADAWPRRATATLGSLTPRNKVTLPPWLPDSPVMREDWAQYLDAVRWTDREVGQIVERLQQAGELERTVIFFLTDHGISHVRCKQFLYDGGTHVPLIVSGPGVSRDTTRDDVVEHIDLTATSLRLAGIPKPEWMHSRDLFNSDGTDREFVFAARDRADETVDLIRSVRSERFKYIWNGFPSRPWLQPNRYKDDKPILQEMRRLAEAGQLTPEQALIMAESRPQEELYDLQNDPWEFRNLADDPQWAIQLRTMRAALRQWQTQTADPCQPEPLEIYLIEAGVTAKFRGKQAENSVYLRNVELMSRWLTERPALPGPPQD